MEEVTTQSVSVGTGVYDATVESAGKHEVVVGTKEWVITNASNYADSMDGDLPQWLSTAISNAVMDGTTDLEGLVEGLSTALSTIETGVNQQISQLQSHLYDDNFF